MSLVVCNWSVIMFLEAAARRWPSGDAVLTVVDFKVFRGYVMTWEELALREMIREVVSREEQRRGDT